MSAICMGCESMLLLSNLIFFLPIGECIHRRLYVCAFFLSLTGIASLVYHMCSSFSRCFVVLDYLMFMDHVLAAGVTQVITVCFVSLLHIMSHDLQSLILLVSITVNSFFVFYREDADQVSTAQFLFNAVYGLVILLLCVYLFFSRSMRLNKPLSFTSKKRRLYITPEGKSPYSIEIHLRYFMAGVLVCAIGYVLFSTVSENHPEYYNIVHSIWHVCCALGLWLLLISARRSIEIKSVL